MSRMVLLVFAMFGMVSVGHAAHTLDGTALLNKCNTAVEMMNDHHSEVVDASYCLGFVNGIMLMTFDQSIELKASHTVLGCAPSQGITSEQGVRIVQKYLNDHLEELHRDAHLLVVYALREAFPCK